MRGGSAWSTGSEFMLLCMYHGVQTPQRYTQISHSARSLMASNPDNDAYRSSRVGHGLRRLDHPLNPRTCWLRGVGECGGGSIGGAQRGLNILSILILDGLEVCVWRAADAGSGCCWCVISCLEPTMSVLDIP